MDDLLTQKITDARAGDVESAIWLLKEFVETVKNNRKADGKPHMKPSGPHTQFQEPLLDYLAKCFGSLIKPTKSDSLRRVTADQALHLAAAGKRGKKASKSTRSDSLVCGLQVLKQYRKYKALPAKTPHLKGRGPFARAIEKIAKDRKISTETAERDYKRFRKLLKG